MNRLNRTKVGHIVVRREVKLAFQERQDETGQMIDLFKLIPQCDYPDENSGLGKARQFRLLERDVSARTYESHESPATNRSIYPDLHLLDKV